MIKIEKWIKPSLILTVLFVLSRVLPSGAVDPWGVFIPKKMAAMVFALTLIQFSGALILQRMGAQLGAILTGFLGGLISSTATTASLAKQGKLAPQSPAATREVLTFLAATIAMHAEGIAILLFGSGEIHPSILVLFIGPIMVAGFLIFLNAKKSSEKSLETPEGKFDLLPVLKLSIFIIAILAISKGLQNIFGHRGILVLTFLVSLFEIHGSFIANIQLHDAGTFDVRMLGNLATLSIAASYLSKQFLVYTLGSRELNIQTWKCTLSLSISLLVSWLAFSLFG